MKNINGGAVFHVVCQVVTYPIRYKFLAEGSFSRIQSGENRRSVHSARGGEGEKKAQTKKKRIPCLITVQMAYPVLVPKNLKKKPKPIR